MNIHDRSTAGAPAIRRTPRETARLRMTLALVEHEYADLLAAARAALAAEARGDPNPLFWIRDELAAHGQLPRPGAVPEQVAAATRYTAA